MTGDERQRVERIPGARRARLTRVEGTVDDADAEATLRGDDEPEPETTDPVVARLRRERPPHYS